MKKLKLLSLVLVVSVFFAGCQSNNTKETMKETKLETVKETKRETKAEKHDDKDHGHDKDHKHDNVPEGLKEEEIKSIEKHGDHYHIKTKDGKEFITHDNPSSVYPNIKIQEFEGDDHDGHDHDHDKDHDKHEEKKS